MAEEFGAEDVQNGKLWAFLAYLLGIIGFIIVLLAQKENKFAMYHAKQSLGLFIAAIVLSVAAMVPFIGWFLIGPIGMLVIIVLWVIGMINALTGKATALPLIGSYAEKINL